MAASQGSKAGLISMLVIVLVLFFVSLFMYWQGLAEAKRAEAALEDFKGQIRKVVSPEKLTAGLQPPAPNDPRYANKPYYDVLLEQNAELRLALIDPKSTTRPDVDGALPRPAAAALATLDRVKQRLEAAGVLKRQNISLENRQLLSVLDPLANGLIALDQKLTQSEAARQKLQDDLLAAQKDAADPKKQPFRQQFEEIQAQLVRLQNEKTELEKGLREQLDKVTADCAKALEEARLANDTVDDQRKLAEARATKAVLDAETMTRTLKKLRAQNLDDSAIRRADGKITELGINGVVWINRGSGEQIYRGLTFEIYDAIKGVPRLGQNDDQLPIGKGSIEVVDVEPGRSKCLVVHTEPGEQLRKGDVIANLAYDPNTKWSFAVYGEFRFNGGRDQIDLIKNRITDFGSQVATKIDSDTDFLVIGREPMLPQYAQQELANSPVAQREMDKAEAKLKEYNDVKESAIRLGIPILNQNKFLCLIGYLDQANR